jgi:rhodanese-related sulfurtransferase
VRRITPLELAQLRTNGRSLALLDVREQWEWNVGHIADATLIPMGQLPAKVSGLDPAADTVLYCHHGARSQAAAEWLVSLGFRRVYNLSGGIDAWSTEVDPSIPRY